MQGEREKTPRSLNNLRQQNRLICPSGSLNKNWQKLRQLIYFHARIEQMIEPQLLIDNINRIGIHFLVDEGNSESTITLTPAELLAGLAEQSDARMRLALIAVLLQRSDFAKYANQALALMDEPNVLTFKLYYTAAHYLQTIYANQLGDVLGS